MAHFIDEEGKLKIEVFTVSPDYQHLDKDRKIEVLTLLKDWLDIEVIKIQFEN